MPARSHGHTVGHTHSPTYSAWASMMARCYIKSASGYERWGGRGIRVCRRWHRFANFLADMGVKPAGMTLERKNSKRNYAPGNCAWATRADQAINRSITRFITFRGERLHLSGWARKLGITAPTLHWRLERWGRKRALTELGDKK